MKHALVEQTFNANAGRQFYASRHLVSAYTTCYRGANVAMQSFVAYLDEEELDEEESDELLELLLLLELLADPTSVVSAALSAISARSCLTSLSLSSHRALNFGLPRLACNQTCFSL